jgi:hypothetical protein
VRGPDATFGRQMSLVLWLRRPDATFGRQMSLVRLRRSMPRLVGKCPWVAWCGGRMPPLVGKCRSWPWCGGVRGPDAIFGRRMSLVRRGAGAECHLWSANVPGAAGCDDQMPRSVGKCPCVAGGGGQMATFGWRMSLLLRGAGVGCHVWLATNDPVMHVCRVPDSGTRHTSVCRGFQPALVFVSTIGAAASAFAAPGMKPGVSPPAPARTFSSISLPVSASTFFQYSKAFSSTSPWTPPRR